LTVERYGYVRQEYGQTTPGEAGKLITLAPNQKLSNLTIQLIPAAAITGHVYDEDGDPVMGAHVSALNYVFKDGQRILHFSGAAQTNDLGEFRLYGLSPGQYIIEAHGPPNRVPKGNEGYLPVYCPGVPDLGRATIITVRSSDELSGADVNLRTSHTVTIHGNVINGVDGGPGLAARVQLIVRGPNTLGNTEVQQDFVRDRQGAFAFANVTPGSYYVHAELSGKEARQPLEVADSDVDGVILNLAPGVDIKGRIRIEGKPDASLGGVQVLLASAENGTFASEWMNGKVKPDGTLLFEDAFDGTYVIDLRGLPENYFLKSARMDGVDVLMTGVTIDTKQAPGLLEIVVSPNGASVDGVISKDQQPFPRAIVAIVPDPPHRGEKRLFKSTSTDENGRFVLQGLSAGDYKVFAWEKIEPGAYTNTDFLQPYENFGESVHITEGSHSSVKVDLIPAKDPGR